MESTTSETRHASRHARRRRRRAACHGLWALAAAASALPGCQSYNGAWKMSSEDRMALKAYYRDRASWPNHSIESISIPRSARHRSAPRISRQSNAQAASEASPALAQARPTPSASDPESALVPVSGQANGSGATAMSTHAPTAPMTQTQAPASDSQTPAIPGAMMTGSVAAGQMALYGQLPSAQTPATHSSEGADNLRRITFTSEGTDFDPVIDPGGTFLVYASTQHRESADLYMKQIDGTAITQLTSDPAHDVMPAFSPDGQRIAFASDRAGNWDIYMMDVSGGQPVQLTSDTAHDIHPSFSPDGRQLIYCSYAAASGQWELVVIDTDSPSTRRYIGPGVFPQWSPAGDRVVYQRPRERGTRWFSVWTIEMQEGEGIRPTEIAASAHEATITPCWSPDGQYVAFSTVDNAVSDQQEFPPHADIWVIAADGSGRANLTGGQFAHLQPFWAADGSIYLVSNRSDPSVNNIWAIRPDRALRAIQGPPAPQPPTVMMSTEPDEAR